MRRWLLHDDCVECWRVVSQRDAPGFVYQRNTGAEKALYVAAVRQSNVNRLAAHPANHRIQVDLNLFWLKHIFDVLQGLRQELIYDLLIVPEPEGQIPHDSDILHVVLFLLDPLQKIAVFWRYRHLLRR